MVEISKVCNSIIEPWRSNFDFIVSFEFNLTQASKKTISHSRLAFLLLTSIIIKGKKNWLWRQTWGNIKFFWLNEEIFLWIQFRGTKNSRNECKNRRRWRDSRKKGKLSQVYGCKNNVIPIQFPHSNQYWFFHTPLARSPSFSTIRNVDVNGHRHCLYIGG